MILHVASPGPRSRDHAIGLQPGYPRSPACRLVEPDPELVRFVCRYLLIPCRGRPWQTRGVVGRPLRILEMDCGIARHAVYFARRGCETWGCDRSPADLDVAREWARELGLRDLAERFRLAEPATLPFADGSFDLVTCHRPMQSLPAVTAPEVFAEVRRVLRPGGWFYCDLVDCPDQSLGAWGDCECPAGPRPRSPSVIYRDAARIEQLLHLGGLELGELMLARPAQGGPDAAHARWFARTPRHPTAVVTSAA